MLRPGSAGSNTVADHLQVLDAAVTAVPPPHRRRLMVTCDATHRVHARVEDRIRTGKDTGIGRFPSHSLAINSAWLTASLIAATLLAWLQLLALPGDLAKAEPKTLRILHAAGRLVRGGRRRRLKIPAT